MRETIYRFPYEITKNQNLFVQSHETASFADKNLKALGPQIWIHSQIRSSL